jgi:antirestriction protein ArdC
MPEMPTNLLTGAQYKGINALVLYMTALHEGYRTNQWVTFKQKDTWNLQHDASMKIVKGNHGSPIFKYVDWIPKDFKPQEGGGYKNVRTGEVKDDPRAIALRSYTVFNVDQMENVPDELVPADEEPNWEERYIAAENAVRTFPCKVKHGAQDKAYYMPKRHFIMMPNRSQFKTAADYYATLFHEHVHSTGPVLERDMTGTMGDDTYAKEELVAELGSALLCARFGIEAPMQHPQYIKGYMKQLTSNDRAFWNAANQAQAAINHLLGETP